jgi:hypothetical protein
MANSPTITPFWHRIPKFFLYGFHPYALILAAFIMAGSYFLGGGLFNFVFYVVMIKYGAEALRHTMDGELTPPKLNASVINENYELPFKLFVVILCYYFVTDRIVDLSGSFAVAITIAIFFEMLIPAIIISLIVTDEIGYALNPINCFNIPIRIGWGYLVMIIFLVLFDAVEYAFTDIIINHIPRNFAGPAWMGINTYFTVIMFHLMGYMVMQYHEELGCDTPNIQESSRKKTPGTQSESALTSPLLERFMEEGNVDAAVAEFSSLIQDNPQDLELRRRAYTYLRANGEHERLKKYAPHYFSVLAEQGRYSDAAGVYIDSVQRQEPFHPVNPSHYLPVMKELRLRNANKEAVLLAQGFHKRFPDDSHTAPLYLEMSRVLSEELQRDDLAHQTLRFVMKKFPGHEVMPEVEQYNDVLLRLNGNPVTR